VLDAQPGRIRQTLRAELRRLPWLCRSGAILIFGGGVFDVACHLLDQVLQSDLAVEEYGGHVVVLVGMLITMAGVWSIRWQRRKTQPRKETSCSSRSRTLPTLSPTRSAAGSTSTSTGGSS
jgi:uncharacterized membrane protein YidH (DUF202 family)